MPNFADRLEPGLPYPLGATWLGQGVNFAVFSANASGMDLCLFDDAGHREIARMPLPDCTNEVWHGYLPHAGPGLVYGFRAQGPYDPHNGHRFNAQKLLLDPYARSLVGHLRWSDALWGYRMNSPKADLSEDRRDSASSMIKARVVADSFDWGDDRLPKTSWSDTVIYEAHVKGLTQLFDKVSPRERGTYAALGHPAVIDHLRRLGITAIELLPIHAFLDDRMLVDKGLRNYWGYNTLAFFVPEPRYAVSDAAHELRTAVRRLHAAGIEVILDVVYNHTCESSELGPTLSWRGLDNASYYRLSQDDKRHLINDTGTGNVLNLSHPRVLQMVMDSLRHFAQNFHIDGFRFDLCTTLGREDWGFDPGGSFFDVVTQDPVLSRLKLIAEPWDIGPGGYQVGNHPPGFAEWNDKYRDTTRRYWRGDSSQRSDFARRLTGSSDLYSSRHRKPWASVNFIAAHDGATLADIVTYEGKYNEANGEENRDGTSDNLSCHWGVEGPTDDPAINTLRQRVMRSMLASFAFSLGTPMLLAGDEFGRTQNGNNNAYCQDNEISWLDWKKAEEEPGAALLDFARRLFALRRRYPLLRQEHFCQGTEELLPDVHDIDWLDERNLRLSEGDWNNSEGRALVMRRAARREDGRVDLVALLMNASASPLEFTLPGDFAWSVLIDSADPQAQDRALESGPYTVQDRTAVLIAAVADAPQ